MINIFIIKPLFLKHDTMDAFDYGNYIANPTSEQISTPSFRRILAAISVLVIAVFCDNQQLTIFWGGVMMPQMFMPVLLHWYPEKPPGLIHAKCITTASKLLRVVLYGMYTYTLYVKLVGIDAMSKCAILLLDLFIATTLEGALLAIIE
jgi:hypothetical protein